MDLTVYVDLLDDFATFAGAIGDFLQKPVELVKALADANFAELSSGTEDALTSSVEADVAVEAGAEGDA